MDNNQTSLANVQILAFISFYYRAQCVNSLKVCPREVTGPVVDRLTVSQSSAGIQTSCSCRSLSCKLRGKQLFWWSVNSLHRNVVARMSRNRLRANVDVIQDS